MTLRQTVAALALVCALTPAGAGAAPFQMAPDQPETVWLLDAANGALRRCGLAATSGPKVVDVFGSAISPREPKIFPARPECVVATPPQQDVAATDNAGVTFVRGMLGDGSNWFPPGSGSGMLGYGASAPDFGDPQNQLFVFDPDRIRAGRY